MKKCLNVPNVTQIPTDNHIILMVYPLQNKQKMRTYITMSVNVLLTKTMAVKMSNV